MPTLIININAENAKEKVIQCLAEEQKCGYIGRFSVFEFSPEPAKTLAEIMLEMSRAEHPADSMDGDETEKLAKEFLAELNKLMGNY